MGLLKCIFLNKGLAKINCYHHKIWSGKDTVIILNQDINKVCHVINGHGLNETIQVATKK